MPNQGRRFSHNYLARGEPTQDSARARYRVLRVFTGQGYDTSIGAAAVERELGIKVPYGYSGRDWERFITCCELRDFLDLITVVAEHVSNALGEWIKPVRTIFFEENLRYEVDSLGGVHFAIDGEFIHNQECSLAALEPARYDAARSHFQAGQRALDQTPPATREAIRQTFEAAETVFRLMFPDVSRLGAAEVTKKLLPVLRERLHGTECDAAGRLGEAFKEWVNGAHPYRHGQAVEAPDNPSVETAVLSVSLGASFIRWLAELDSRHA